MNASEMTRRGLSWTSRLAPLAVIAFALPFASPEGKAQSARFGDAKTVEGTIRSVTTAPVGEVDGAVLDDGTVIHWPPHLADRFTAVASRGDRVRATGRIETGPAGDTHLEVQTVANLRTNTSAENDFGPPSPPPVGRRPGPPPPQRGPRFRVSKTAQGRVLSLTTAPMGEVDGATLDDGAVIHWPPHLADRFTAVIARGDRVKVSGWMETGPAGDAHLEVQTATNLRTSAVAGNDLVGPPSEPPGRVAFDDSDDFLSAPPDRPGDIERRLKALEDQINQLRGEIRRLRRDP